MTALITLAVNLSLLVDRDLQPFRERIYNGSAHSVKSAGHLIAPAAKFSACMKDGKYDFHRRNPGLVIDADRNTTAVVNNRDGIVFINRHIYRVTESCKCFVDGVIHNLINQMMKTTKRCASDVHTWSFADSFKPLQNLDLIGSIFLIYFCSHIFLLLSSSFTDDAKMYLKNYLIDLSFHYVENFIYVKPVLDKIIQPGTGDKCLYIVYPI